jgi:hypothetical protein
MITMEAPQAKRIGTSTLGGTNVRPPRRWVGVERSSRFAARYDAKKKIKRIFANSTGSKENRPKSIQSRAPFTEVPMWGMRGETSSKMAATSVR